MKIIPTVFAHNIDEFNSRFEKIVRIAKEIQIDFMDGDFVKAKSIELKDMPDLKKFKGKKFEAHLMVSEPEEWIFDLKKKGFKKVIFHYETFEKNDEIIELIDNLKKADMEAWIAINPDTDIEEILCMSENVKGVLLMGVYPGEEGQEFISGIYDKIKKLRKMVSKKTLLQVDGGVNLNTIREIKKAGADIVNVGGFVGKAENPKEALDLLKREIS